MSDILTKIIGFIPVLIYFIVALDIIVVVHELGHLLTAKRYGVYCYEFAIGMGPKLFTFHQDKTGTIYNVRAIPIGGFVQMAGEESSIDEENEDVHEKLAEDQLIVNKPPYQRLIIFVAGVVMNFILAFLIILGISFTVGVNVQEDYFAKPSEENAYTEQIAYDEYYITNVDGKEASSVQEALLLISKDYEAQEKEANGEEFDFTQTITVQDVDSGDTSEVNLDNDSLDQLQIASVQEHGIKAAFVKLGSLISQIVDTLRLLFTGSAGLGDLSGPVGILSISDSVLSEGFVSAIYFVAFLSVNIGFVNLLPIPALDGGRIVFTLYEMIFRRKVSKKIEERLIVVTFVLLIGLMIYVTFNDIIRIVQGVIL